MALLAPQFIRPWPNISNLFTEKYGVYFFGLTSCSTSAFLSVICFPLEHFAPVQFVLLFNHGKAHREHEIFCCCSMTPVVGK